MMNGLPRPKGLVSLRENCMMMWEAINKRHCEIFARKSWQSMAEKSLGVWT